MKIPVTTFFLQHKLFFLVTVSVLATTLFSLFNLNSYCIILLVACRLFWGGRPLAAIKTAFRNPLFLAYFAFFLVEAAGLLHTHNMGAGFNIVSKDCTIVSIAFVLCCGSFAGPEEYRKLIRVYILLLLLASLYCLVIAGRNYVFQRDADVFFYHLLTRPISQNAVFYSVFVLFGLVYLLSPEGELSIGAYPAGVNKGIRVFLVLFFLLMMVLLNSKLLLVIALLLVANFLTRKFSFRKNRRMAVISGLALLSVLLVFMLTDNPIVRRYKELAAGNLELVRQEKFSTDVYFNALQLRLLEWRFALEILNEHEAWLFGVSPGDSQDLLDNKYVITHMYIGDPSQGPHRKVRGFIGYNFHNQYLETMVRDGLVGLLVLLVIFGLLIGLVLRYRTREAVFIVGTLIVFFIPEAPLTLQHGVFLFCFFPLLLPYSVKSPE